MLPLSVIHRISTAVLLTQTIYILPSIAEICIARSLKIPREIKPDTFENIISELTRLEKVKIVVLFVNEDNCKRLINASIALAQWKRFYFLASDSWGAKAVPVQGQEEAAEGTVTILPQKKRLDGEICLCEQL